MKRSVLAVILAAGLTPLWAQDPGPADTGDSPDHGVARLSIVQGNVSIRHGDAGDVTAGVVNAPLVETDRVVTGEGGRAEVQFDIGNLIRLAPGSEVRLSELRYKQFQVQIAAGTTTFRVLGNSDAQVEISTPTISVHPGQPGSYRVSVQPDGMTEITVRQGEAEIFGPQGTERLRQGQSMLARGNPNDPEFQIVGTIPTDDWDRWNLDQDRRFQQTSSNRYVPPDVYGTEQLDGYGQWQNDPSYGNVWVPNEGQDWAPYQDGRWSDIDYYGPTWISGDPWGWAPYHYGNWYRSRWGWAWWPGAIGPRYYWRPALVGFFGWGGGGFGVGFGFGNVGWVPLAPFEVYHPWYGRGFVGGGRFNIVNNTNITNVYRNARVANGVTSMRASEFGRSAINGNNRVRATSADLARAGAIRGAMPFTASAQSRQFSNATVNTRGVPQTNANARFFSRANAGQSGGQAGVAGRNAAPGRPQAQGSQGTSQGGGWQRLGPSGSNPSAANRGGAAPGGGSNPGFAQNRGGGSNGPAAAGPGATGASGGGNWRRLDGNPSGGAATAPRTNGPQGGGAPQPGYRPAPQQPQGQGFSGSRPGPAPQQPIRVNPPIVQNRGSSGGGGNGGGPAAHPPSHAGDFGGAHSGGGGNNGGGNRGGGGGGGGNHGRR